MNKYSDIFVANEKDIKGRIYNASNGQLDVDGTYADAYIHVMNKINKGAYKEGNMFMPWVHKVVTNFVIDVLRRDRIKYCDCVIDGKNFNNYILELHSNHSNPEIDLISVESVSMVQEAIESLCDSQRSTVKRWIYEEKKMREIAEEDGVGLNTTLARNSYAKNHIKEFIKNYEELH